MGTLMKNILQSQDEKGEYTYLMNTYNGCSIKYSNKIFEDEKKFIENPEIKVLLEEESFFDDWEISHKKVLQHEEKYLKIALLIHENCNFRCTYCYEKFQKNAMSQDVMQSIVKYVEEQLNNENSFEGLHISWFGGEPLLNIRGIEYLSVKFMEICKKYKKQYSADITTNGYALSQKAYKKLVSYKVNNYQITIDGPQKYHDNQRILVNGQGTYKKIIDNLIDISKNTNDESLIVIRTNVGPENLDTMDTHILELIRLFEEDKRFDFTFHNIGNWGETCLDVIDNNVALDLSERAVDLGGRSEGILWNLMPDAYCYAGKRNNYVIGSDGLVYKCTVMLYDERNIIGKISEGKILIDDNKEALWLRDRVNTDCQDCSVSLSCLNKKCPASNLNNDSNSCLFTRRDLVRLLRLMDKQNLFTYTIG